MNNNINNLKDFESLFYKKMRGLSKDNNAINDRIRKLYELIILKNDASPIASINNETLRRISIVLTTWCNLKCVWCHREEKHVKDSGYLSKHMDFEKLKLLLPDLKGFQVLSWGGLGEPMLYKDFYEATEVARKFIPIVKTTSNGTTLTKANIKKLANCGLNLLEVSIDGFDENANKKLRGTSENIIIENIEQLSSDTTIPIQINTVVSEENYNSLLDAVFKLKNVKNIFCLHTIPLFMTKHMQELGIKALTREKYLKLLNKWKNDISSLNLNWELSPDATQIQFDPVTYTKSKHNICFSPFEDPTINVDGEIVPCSRLQHLGLGNVFQKGFKEVWNGKKMIQFRSEQLKGNYGDLCQRECSMKNLSEESKDIKIKKLKEIHSDIGI